MTLVTNGQHVKRFEDVTDPRLGRHIHLDARSLAFTVERDLDEMAVPIRARHWERHIPILDQGQLGSCVGNAATGALGTSPLWDRVGAELLDPNNAAKDEAYAVDLYEETTRTDPYDGAYPPDDTGTDGLSAAKTERRRGHIRSYSHATTAHGLLVQLQRAPVMLGMPWREAFFEPDPRGFIDDEGWGDSALAGGHEVLIVGLDPNQRDAPGSVLTVANSWGRGWGDHGYFRMRLATYTILRSQCDLIQLQG